MHWKAHQHATWTSVFELKKQSRKIHQLHFVSIIMAADEIMYLYLDQNGLFWL